MLTRLILLLIGVAILGGATAGGLWLVRGRVGPIQRAERLVQAGDLRGAFIELRTATREKPDDPAPHMTMADLWLRLSDPAAAGRELARAQTLGADKWAVLTALAPVLAEQGRFRELLVQIPKDGPRPDITQKLLLARGGAQLALTDEAAARASLEGADKAVPNSAAAAGMAARLALARDDLTEAERQVDVALQRDPAWLEALLMKQRFAVVRGDAAAAMALADRVVAAAPWSSVARLDRANLLMGAGQDAKARVDVDAVLVAQPRDASALLASGVLLLRAGRFTEAAVELQKLNGVAKGIPRVLLFQAMAAGYLNQNESALDLVSRYLILQPGEPDGVRLLARIELASQRPEQALAALQRLERAELNDPRSLDLFGTAQMMLGRLNEAAESFRGAAATAPDDAQILRHLGLSELRVRGSGLAKALDRLAELAPGEPAAGESLVATALAAGELERASAALERLRAQTGNTEVVGILTGSLRLARQDSAGAEAAFADVVKRFPDSVNARLNLARVLALRGSVEEGEALLLPLLTAQPANLRVLSAYVQSLVNRQAFTPAIQALEAARKAAPGNFGFAAMLSDVFVRLGDPRRAIIMLQALRRLPDMPPILLVALSRAQLAAGQVDDARATLEVAVRESPSDMALRRAQVDLLLRQDDPGRAMATLRDALRSVPGNYSVMSGLVMLEARRSGVDAALKVARTLRADPANMPQAGLLAGEALMRAKRSPEAVAAFQAEQRSAPSLPVLLRLADALVTAGRDDEAAQALRAWLDGPGRDDVGAEAMLSKLDIKAKRYPDAQARLERVLDKRPDDAVARNNLAWVYLMTGDARARATAQRAYLQSPSSDAADTLGWALVQQGEARAAVPLLRQSGKDRPNDPSVTYHLAVALRDDGKPEEAASLLQAITASGAPFDEAPQARALLQTLRGRP